MSQLQAQLRKIAATAKAKQPRNERASLLYDARQAAETDLETIYALGLNGLEELKTHKCVSHTIRCL
jgi:U3 small nucleolar RNA-associated protein 10